MARILATLALSATTLLSGCAVAQFFGTGDFPRYGYYQADGNWYFRGNNQTYKVDGADRDTFVVINDDYAKDKRYVYDRSVIVKGVDPTTFRP
ncbi:hypothetical protein GN109_23245 [Collimonas pratensis]|nr:hypothetical protein [Collimonas pratensis]